MNTKSTIPFPISEQQAGQLKWRNPLLLIWGVTMLCFILGVSLPMATVTKVVFLKHHFSLLSSLGELFHEGGITNIGLFLLILFFSLLFPLLKLLTLLWHILTLGKTNHKTTWLFERLWAVVETVGHFSMLDIFVIALMVLLLKLRVVVNVTVHAGFWVFTLSVILSILLTLTLRRVGRFNATP